MTNFDAVVISDLHLGAHNSRSEEILRFLDTIETRQLIVNGDLFNDFRLRGLRPADVRVIEALRAWGQTGTVHWLLGNHDPPAAWFRTLLGIEARDELTLDVGDRRYLVCHGHVWDRALELPYLLIRAADTIYSVAQRVDKSHRLARGLKRASKHFCRAVTALRNKAVAAARERQFDGVVLGHTHVGCESWHDGVHYLNSGCWTERPCSYVGIRDGVARQVFWETRSEPPAGRRAARKSSAGSGPARRAPETSSV